MIENENTENLIGPQKGPSVYDYTDYRSFLKDSLSHLKTKNPMYSESAFIQKAGYGANSRGYFTLILKKKRNLSSKSTLGFSKSLKLNEKEGNYFENLVLYNQAKDESDKRIYFERLSKSASGKKTKSFNLLKGQYNYLTNWYIVAIRELISLVDFEEDPAWISKKLRGRVSKKQVVDALEDLLRLGLVVRDDSGKLIVGNEFVNVDIDSSQSFLIVDKIHRDVLDLAKDTLSIDRFDDRSYQCAMMSIKKEQFPEMRKEVNEFLKQIRNKYCTREENPDLVLSLGTQLLKITNI